MSKLNVLDRRTSSIPVTHEGARAKRITATQELKRSIMACLLWEDTFYESGVDIAKRIAGLVPQVPAEDVALMAIEARSKMKLRHIPLFLVYEMTKHNSHKALVGSTLENVIQRVDEITEYLAIYSKGRTETKKLNKLSSQSRKGIAAAFNKFNEYQFAKYNRPGAVSLKDALFLSHAKPKDDSQAVLFKKIVDGTLETPDTWEVALSGGSDKKETFERLIVENKLGGLALLRNLRNMQQSGVEKSFASGALNSMNKERILPFRFISAARAVPQWEDIIEIPMLQCLDGREKLPGKTALLVDNSGSMIGTKVSAKSDIDRLDAACALAILIREIAENPLIIGFGSDAAIMPPRHGFALADAIKRGPGGGTNIQTAVDLANRHGYDRIIIITDEQSHQKLADPKGKGYVINVASYQNGVGYGAWGHIDGFSESVVDYITEIEKVD